MARIQAFLTGMAARKKIRIIRSSKRSGKTLEAVRLAAAQESVWREKFHAQVVFEREHGHCDVPLEAKLYRALSAWITTQRDNAANGVLPPEKKAETEAHGVDFTPDDAAMCTGTRRRNTAINCGKHAMRNWRTITGASDIRG